MLDLSPIVHTWALPFFGLLFAGLTLWIGSHTKAWLDAHVSWLSVDQRQKISHMEDDALQQGADYVMAWLEREGAQLHPVVNSWLLRQGAQVAIDHAGGILADNGASPDEVANKILARLPAAYVTTDFSAAAKLPPHYEPVTISPLPPLPTTKETP